MSNDKRPEGELRAETTRARDEPTDVAGITARVEADFWKMRAQMMIYHQEKVADLDRVYETLFGKSPSKLLSKRAR
jgi:hypothetical protein